MTHEQFITLETARLAKQAGFDWEVRDFFSLYEKTNKYEIVSTDYAENYNESVYATYSAPTQAVLQRWLREVKNMECKVYSVNGSNWCKDEPRQWWQCDISQVFGCVVTGEDNGRNTTYEAALEAGLQKCLTLLIEK